MLDNIATFFLLFSHATLIVPIMLLGFFLISRSIFYHAMCILLFGIIINYTLKITFQIPLSLALAKQGFAFPSGHMQAATVFYGWISFKLKNTLVRLLIALLLTGIGISLAHFGYHNYYDVLGGISFALVLIAIYNFILLKSPTVLPWILVFAASILMTYIAISAKILNHLWVAYGVLLVLAISNKIFRKII